MTNTTPQPTRFSTIQRLLAILVAIVIVLLASVLSNKVSAPQADAALSPHFCIGASSDEGKFVGKHGPAHCGEPGTPEVPTVPGPQTRLVLMQTLALDAGFQVMRETDWADGVEFDPTDLERLPAPLAYNSAEGAIECAPQYDSCEVRVSAVSKSSGSVIARASSELLPSTIPTMVFEPGQPFVWKQEGVVASPVNEFTAVVGGVKTLAEAKAEISAPSLYTADDLRFEAQFYASQGGSQQLMGSVILDSDAIACTASSATVEDWNGERVVTEDSFCYSAL